MIDLAVEERHGSVFGADSSQPIFLLDVPECIDEAEIPLLDILPGFAQPLHFLLKGHLALHFEFLVLFATDRPSVVQFQQLLEVVHQLVLELLLFELEVRDAGKKLIGQELVVSAVGGER